MSAFDESSIVREKAGQPTGGRFAEKQRAGSGITLAAAPAVLPADYEVDEDFPHPQANDLDKIACVVDAVSAGANTPEAVADALGLHPREGAYYADAAGYLGLVERVPGEEITTYATTSLGNELAVSDEQGRAALVREMVAHVPAVAIYDAEGDEAVVDFLSTEGLGASTAARRAATIRSWAHQTADPGSLAGAVRVTQTETIHRAADAAERARAAAEERRRIREAAQVREMPPCPSCFMQLPSSGVCECGYVAEAAAA